MHSLKAAAAIVGVIVFTGACSSGLDDDAKTLEPSAGFDSVYRTYDLNSDEFIVSEELSTVENGSAVITAATAQSVLESYDMNGDKKLDKVEFTGLMKAKILVGVSRVPGWGGNE